MLKVGITGGIGVGKSIVCRMFEHLGIPVYDADTRAKWVMLHDEPLKHELVQAFGAEAYNEAGELNRSYISGIVFKNPERLAQLNSLVHPRVRNDFSMWVAANQNAPYIIKEAALMYESEAWRQIDKMIAVFAPKDVRIKRLLIRDTHRTEADIQAIMDKQLREEEKMARADYIIYNDDHQLLIPQVLKLHEQLLEQSLS
ncbi:dephospho-CoA kinase [Pontibacter sp. SGAir0037]|uniref:dephospho-CoA kinase n=1 Tax=Pontibacter sp. SGAir0037 TaxID=2571030 RepID=UPI0010CCD300|nr:dephospho-CoA kinase [Pontibacter sp. SGAir0037]QCR24085.1 dephospho-CoA kinase [Pontibacter sp. SGAir0037]